VKEGVVHARKRPYANCGVRFRQTKPQPARPERITPQLEM
jgi:hypothetical protein